MAARSQLVATVSLTLAVVVLAVFTLSLRRDVGRARDEVASLRTQTSAAFDQIARQPDPRNTDLGNRLKQLEDWQPKVIASFVQVNDILSRQAPASRPSGSGTPALDAYANSLALQAPQTIVCADFQTPCRSWVLR